MTNEKDFIKQLQSSHHKEEAFRELVKKNKERLYWHIRKIVINHEDANDVIQNTFIKVFKNINTFKGDCKIYTWMYRIATNEAITFLNKKAKKHNTSIEGATQNAINNLQTDVYFKGDEIQLKLQKAISTLPKQQQLVFNMKYFDDHTFKDLSGILETSEGGLKANYHLAVKKIKHYLENTDL
ncbi:MAG: RNA polymerase sigma factor [Flavobacteriales bacterium]